jgi:hypothetical protein
MEGKGVVLILMTFPIQVGNVILSAAKNLARHTEILRCAQNDNTVFDC